MSIKLNDNIRSDIMQNNDEDYTMKQLHTVSHKNIDWVKTKYNIHSDVLQNNGKNNNYTASHIHKSNGLSIWTATYGYKTKTTFVQTW